MLWRRDRRAPPRRERPEQMLCLPPAPGRAARQSEDLLLAWALCYRFAPSDGALQSNEPWRRAAVRAGTLPVPRNPCQLSWLHPFRDVLAPRLSTRTILPLLTMKSRLWIASPRVLRLRCPEQSACTLLRLPVPLCWQSQDRHIKCEVALRRVRASLGRARHHQ